MSFSRAVFAGVAVAVIAAISTTFYLRSDDLATGVGEQRTLTLEDGTRVYLNTDTLIAQHYDPDARRVELERGEALFEVAKRPDWPFIVTAGDKQVRALGTAFVVRRDEQNLAITLVEGKVTVAPISLTGNPPQSFPRTRKSSETAKPSPTAHSTQDSELDPITITLSPGERLTFAGTAAPVLDKPAIERVTAWQRGQVALDNTPLADAVAEMNRYSRVRLVIQDPRVATIPVSGIFRAGDSNDFAHAVAKTYGLDVVERRTEIILSDR